MISRRQCQHLIASVLLGVCGGPTSAASFDEVLAPLSTAPSQCREIEGTYAYGQAKRLYEKEGLTKTFNIDPQARLARSYECKGKQTTVYLYSYAGVSAAQKADEGFKELIWGGQSRSSHHPEYIFTVENVVVVVSGDQPKYIAKLMTAKK
jgi:hypothetical protein